MNTAAFEAIGRIPDRITELKSLSKIAREIRDRDERVYNATCRACAVLISAHLEGGVKDICDSVRVDLNYFVKDFRRLPTALKRGFCHRIAFYEGVEKKLIETRVGQLVTFFERNTVPVEMDAFQYLETQNKNPKPSNIDGPFERFGVVGALSAINSEFLLQAFSESPKRHFILRRELIRNRANLYKFPYKPCKSIAFAAPIPKKKAVADGGLWHTYLEEIVTRRHKIVHGDTLENSTTVDELDLDIFKAEILLYSLALYFCAEVASLLAE